MDVLAAVLLTVGFLGTLCSFSFAWGFREYKKTMITCLIIGFICLAMLIVGIVLMSGSSTPSTASSNSDHSARCSSCDTTYSYSDDEYGTSSYDNVRNIRKTGMCNRCYKNYKYAID